MAGSEEFAAAGDAPAGPTVDSLPPRLRSRVISVCSNALGRVPPAHIPPALRKSANFAAAKRSKLVGTQIVQALDRDDEFREHVATQVRALAPAIVNGLGPDTSDGGDEADNVTAAAVAFVVRPEGWEDVVAAAARAEVRRQAEGGDLTATVEKLRAELAVSRAEVKTVRDKLRAQLDDVKSDNASLRRTVGQTRQQLKLAQRNATERDAAIEETRCEAVAASRVSAAELRRLRARIDQLESQTSATRRSARDDRQAETMRRRLLLDTIMDSAAGLRRELALPPTDLLPADTVRAIEPDAEGSLAGVGRSLQSDDPMLLRRLLELPRAHLIVDGYNVSKSAWPTSPLDEQRNRLSGRVAALAAGKGIEATIVFDGADLVHPPNVAMPRGLRVLFSPPGVIADDTIRHLVSAEPVGRPLVVVSTDREVAESVTKMGARSVTSQALIAALGV